VRFPNGVKLLRDLAGDLPAAERHLIHHLQSAEETLRGVAKTHD
jgi:hypothetical protein